MGNSHPTRELIQSITEYVNARYVSSERVASYEVPSEGILFGLADASPAGAYRSAPPEALPGGRRPAPPREFTQAYEPLHVDVPVKTDRCQAPASKPEPKRSRLRRLFQNKSVAKQGSQASYPEEEVCQREPEFSNEAVGSPTEQPSFSVVNRRSLEDLIKEPGESFAAMLFRLIDEKGLTDPDVYNKAGVSRQTFSKIRSKEDYAPSKDTVIALAMALGLTLDEVQDLLNTAGFALSNSSKSDIVISYFFDHGMHDLDLLNEALYELGFAVIGGR